MDLQALQNRITELENWKSQLEASHSIPLNVDQAFGGRGFIKLTPNQLVAFLSLFGITGVISTNGTTFSATTPLAGTKIYYVANSSGGAVTRKLTFTGGILTAEV